ncbi:MAG: N-acetylmuramoyl-L-alanine amidase [Deltaproteobacteria bacterium]|nr:N-acetylmuramoyl-L-alanine amidase [Deltaproteobacteria bacterium]
MLRRLVLMLTSVLCTAVTRPALAKSKPKPEGKSVASTQALEAAKRDWQELKHDRKRSRFRAPWLKVAAEFAAVAKRYPTSPEAPKALFDAGELYEDLSRISWIQDDVDAAVALYGRLGKDFPKDALADDAHLALARIALNRKNDADTARAELKTILKSYPRGDMAPQAKTMLAQLKKGDESPREEVEKPAKVEVAKAEPKVAPKPEPKVVEAKGAEPKAEKAQKDAAPSVKVTEVEWADAQPAKVPQKAPPIVDAAAVDGQVGADAIDMDDENDSPTPEASTRPLTSIKLAGADKGKLAAIASAMKSSDDDLPLSAQMGLKVRRVVIDAGHGGHDTGAVGPTGVKEKDVTLSVAKKLAEKLKAQGLEVFMTRTTDRFVSLENRAAFANEQHADLFISVHCNAATQRTLHGVETYSLNISSDRYAVRLAARENASSERSIGDLQFMLADLATRANTADSRELASLVQRSVVEGLRTRFGKVRDLGTKEALFYVLLGTRMPAVLVEGSFISNPEEEKRLEDGAFQEQLAGSIASGVERFVGDRAALATAGLP